MKISEGEIKFSRVLKYTFVRAFIIAVLLLFVGNIPAQNLMPTSPNVQLGTWSFNDTSWYSDLGYAPISFTNLANPPSFEGNALQVDATNAAAWLGYNIVESNGTTNLTLDRGTIELWFLPDWNSGAGPGDWGRLIEVGTYTTNTSVGWWSLYFSPDGSSLNFSSQTNGAGSNYLSFPISWDTNTWHFVALTYSRFRSALYIDGQLATNGPGVLYLPGAGALTNGFYVGSDNTGTAQSRGLIDDLATYNYTLSPDEITNDYAAGLQLISPSSGGFQMASSSSGLFPGGGGTNSSGGGTPSIETYNVNYGTNLWIARFGIATNFTVGILSNSQPDVQYEILTTTNLLSQWTSAGFFSGSEITNWTPLFGIPVRLTNNLFLQVRSWANSTGTGIPDWWWLKYFGQTTNVNAYAADPAGDGYTDLQKFQMGLSPTQYYTTNAVSGFVGCLDASGTNVFLYWNDLSGPVSGYVIQRGVYNSTNSSYAYSQIATASSNAISFKDSGVFTNFNSQYFSYQITAEYPAGSLSATNTWNTDWFTPLDSGSGTVGPPNGPPVPGNPYACLDATGTNVIVSWTPSVGAATNYVIERLAWDSTNYTYTPIQIGQASTNNTSFSIAGEGTNADVWNNEYGVAAEYPGGGLSTIMAAYLSVGFANGVAAPGTLYGYTDTTGTNLLLTWSPVSGAVANYIILGGTYNNNTYLYQFDRLGMVGSNTTSFEVIGALDDSGYDIYDRYAVIALLANGNQSQAAVWSAGSNPPGPEALYAYLDDTCTNVQLAWSAATGAITGYLIQRSDDYGYSWSFYEVTNVTSATNLYDDIDAVDNGSFSLGVTAYEVQATYPNGVLSSPVIAMVTNTPPVPGSFSANLDGTGTNVVLTWSPAAGAVASYTIERGTLNPATGVYSYSTLGTVGANTTTFTDAGAIGNSHNQLSYLIKTTLADGSVSQLLSSPLSGSSPAATVNLNVGAQLVRNSTGHLQLMFSEIPSQAQSIILDWCVYDYLEDQGPLSGGILAPESIYLQVAIPVGSITNGTYVIPDWQATNWISDTVSGPVLYIQALATNNAIGTLSLVGYFPNDAPCFVDGRQHLKQNLLFSLRAATKSQSCIDLFPFYTNYVESSCYIDTTANYPYYEWDSTPFVAHDNLWPITVNYLLHKILYDTNYTSPTAFIWQTNLMAVPAPAVLAISTPYWIQPPGAVDPTINGSIDFESPLLLADLGGYTNNGNLYLLSGQKNVFGLDFTNALVNESGWDGNYYHAFSPLVTVAPGTSVPLTDVNCIFIQTVAPSLVSTGYYFAPVILSGTTLPSRVSPIQPYPLPCLNGFASTNRSGLLVTSVGNPVSIGAWNKLAITNGNTNKFAYLGQYFETNAFLLDGSGNITTNATGVVSPYGDLFPTEPGLVAMVTMPDIDPPYEQGTGVVRVVSLNVDANHDGVMDFTYTGPDFVSASKPFRFWVNDDSDSGDYGGSGIPGQGLQGDGMRPSLYVDYKAYYKVHGMRDLVDFFPVYVNIGSLFQSNALSAGINYADTNWQFVLSQADGVLRYVATDLTPTNYLDFLRDTNEVEYLAGASLTTITNVVNGGVPLPPSFIAGIATNNQGILLVEAAAPTTQPLVLTIYHGTNQIAQTALPLSISGVEQMFRSKTMLLNPVPGAMPDRLTDASVPNEPDTTNSNFVFVHGYNVLPDEARGTFSDVYKRLYWSGSHAKFWGVTWEGADTKNSIPLKLFTPNYYTNIVNAFLTAPNLANFIATLTNSGPVTVAAHSMGNVVTLSAISDWNAPISHYFMLDAAVPMEAIDPGVAITNAMVYSSWVNYSNRLYASDWYQLFPTNDARSTLTWNNRLGNLRNVDVYNFYSSGEEVLREYDGNPPINTLSALAAEVLNAWPGGYPLGTYAWVWQEKGKGTCIEDGFVGGSHGGWKFSTYWVDSLGFPLSPTNMNNTTNTTLRYNPMFDFNSTVNSHLLDIDSELLGAVPGPDESAYAATNRNRILSDAIPALTLPVGANPATILDQPGNTHNFNMNTPQFQNGWPPGRGTAQYPPGTTAPGEWHHSDFCNVAYTFTYNLFDQFVTIGNLK